MDITVSPAPPLIRSARASLQLRTATALLAAAILAFAAACGPGSPPDTAIRNDSAGVTLVEYPSLPPIEESRIALAAEPDLVLGDGRAFEGPDYDFFQIAGVSQLGDGTLIVANQGSRELRFFGADGQFLRSAGGDGDGPGEFRRVQGPWIIESDTIVVFDMSLRRFQLFSPDGAFVRVTPMTGASFTGFLPQPRGLGVVGNGILGNGRAVMFLDPDLPPGPTNGVQRLPNLLALHRLGDGGWDSVRVVAGIERIVEVRGESLTLPGYKFNAYPVAAGAGATAAVADAARFRVELYGPDGRLVSILSASVPTIPVTSDVIEGAVEHWLANAMDVVPEPGPARAAYAERIRDEFLARHAPVLPAIRDLFVDADERIWVERYDVPARGPSRWEVFERDGTWISRVEMPEGFTRGRRAMFPWAPYFSVASGRLAGVWTDPDTGLETVRVYRLIEPDS